MIRREPFRVGEWEVMPLEGRIAGEGGSERLRPKAMDVLCLLASRPGEVVERDTILGEIWGRTAVTDEPLTATVGELRRTLGDRRGTTRYIETIPKRGYRLVAEVSETAAGGSAPPGDGLVNDGPSNQGPVDGRSAVPGRRWPAGVVAGALLIAVVAVVAFIALWQADDETTAQTPESIAVLPFAVQDEAGPDRYFGDGLAQEILTTLSSVGELRVVARHSAFEFRGERDDLDGIRAGLGVDSLLDGSIRRDRDRLRVNVQLIDLRTGYNLWAQTYDRRIGDTFLLQSEIARAIAGQLSVRLGGAAGSAGQDGPPPDAYLPYLHGRYLFESSRNEAGLREAIRYLQESLAVDGGFAPAHAALAGAWMQLADLGAVSPAEGYGKGAGHARQALKLDPDLPEAHALLGWMRLYYEWDWDGAARSLERALELAPGDGFVLSANAALNFHLGQFDRAVRLAAMATERDPLRASPFYNLAYFRFAAGDIEGAGQALERVEELAPGYALAGLLRVQIDLARGHVERAGSRIEANPILALVAEALVADARGDREAALRTVEELEQKHAQTAPYQIAGVYARLGDEDMAFRWLERALEVRDPGLTELAVDPLLGSLRGDPRYRDLLVRVGLPSSSRDSP